MYIQTVFLFVGTFCILTQAKQIEFTYGVANDEIGYYSEPVILYYIVYIYSTSNARMVRKEYFKAK